MKASPLMLGAAMFAALSLGPAAAQDGDAVRGDTLYRQRCGACHSIDANRVGPMHRGVYGRRAGAVSDFQYSPALRRLGVTWDENSLDQWLTSPTAMAPGTSMGIGVPAAQDRADIIAYLRTQR